MQRSGPERGRFFGRWRTLSDVFDLKLKLGAALFDWAKPKGAVLDLSSFDLILTGTVLDFAFSFGI